MENKNESLTYTKKSAFDLWDSEKLAAAMNYSAGYMKAVDRAKTEREAVEWTKEFLAANGYAPYRLGDKIKKGGKYFLDNRKKSLIAFSVGNENISEGVRIIAAHIDSPRLDLKQHPLFEDGGCAYLKTHYYGGLRKYQWVTIPLQLRGVVATACAPRRYHPCRRNKRKRQARRRARRSRILHFRSSSPPRKGAE